MKKNYIDESDPAWVRQLQGRTTEAFNHASRGGENRPPAPNAAGREFGHGSHMVRSAAFGLHEGPTPPGLTRGAVTRASFNRRWREESRGFRSMRWKLREEFNRKAGPIRNGVVQSEQSTKSRLLRNEFNRAAHPKKGRSL